MAHLIMQSTPVLTLVYLITTSYTVYACLVLTFSLNMNFFILLIITIELLFSVET